MALRSSTSLNTQVRPGGWYGPEYTDSSCTLLVLHPSHGGAGEAASGGKGSGSSDPWVSWEKAPDGPYVVQYTFTATAVL